MRTLTCLLWALLLAACGEIAATNPYDPTTPAAQRAPATVRGRVALPAGFASTHLATVRLALRGDAGDFTASPDAEGAFVFSEVPAAEWRLGTEGPFLAAEQFLPLRAADTVDLGTLPLTADARSTVLGTARLTGAEAHDGTRVSVAGTPFVSTTAADGAFALPLIAGSHTLRFQHAGYADATARVELAAGQTLTLTNLIELAGDPGRVRGLVVLDGNGDPAALDAVVVTLRTAPDAAAAHTGAPTRDGSFLLDAVAPGPWWLQVERAGWQTFSQPVQVPPGGEPPPVRAQLARGASTGRVRGFVRIPGAGDLGHEGTRVAVDGLDDFTASGPDGAWHLDLPARADGYTLIFQRTGYDEARREVRPVEIAGVHDVPEVLLQGQPARVLGAVRLDALEGAAPFPPEALLAVAVSLEDVGEAAEPRRETPALDGRFAFEGVPAGSYGVRVAREGFVPRYVSVDVPVGAEVNVGLVALSLRLDANTYINGRALKECPAPPCDHGGILVEAVGQPFTAVTNREGAFLLEVIEGRYDLRFSAPGYADAEALGVAVAAGETATVPAEPEAPPPQLALLPARVEGRVLRLTADGARLPAAGAAVQIVGPAGPLADALADEEGRFALAPRTPAGQFDLVFTLAAHAPTRLALRLTPGETTQTPEIVLDLLRGGLTGTATRLGGPVGGGVTVVAESDAPDRPRRTTLAVPPDDHFTFDDLPVGTWQVTALAAGHRTPERRSVEIVADETQRLDLELPVQRAELRLPEVVGADAVLTLVRDPELTHGQIWLDDTPAGPFVRLPDDEVPLDAGADGPHRVQVRLANAAYVDADPTNDLFTTVTGVLIATTLKDTAPPAVGRVEIAGGAGTVNALSVPMVISDTDATAVAVWNEPWLGALACAETPACDDPRFGPFTPARTHTLDPPEGPKLVCVRLCDAACNCTESLPNIVNLGTFVDRPAPEVEAISPAAVAVFATAPDTEVTVLGRGIAYDTVARVGDFVFPCATEVAADACRRCGDACDADCADTCRVDLSGSPLLRNSGTYVVRLETPAPVYRGQGLSSGVAFLNIVAGVPRIVDTSPRGVAVADLLDPALLALFNLEVVDFEALSLQPVVPATVEVEIRACAVPDNAQIRLGFNLPRSLSTLEMLADDPECGGGPGRRYRALFDTVGLTGLAPEEQVLVITSPAPGGGTARQPFGITELADECLADGLCVADLSRSRPLMPDGVSHYFPTRMPDDRPFGLRWSGGDRADVRDQVEAEDAPDLLSGRRVLPTLAAGVDVEASGGLVPMPHDALFGVGATDELGTQPPVTFARATQRGSGRFDAPVVLARVGRGPTALRALDLDADGDADLVSASGRENTLSVRPNLGGTFTGGQDVPTGRNALDVGLADLDGDGRPDAVVPLAGGHLAVMLGVAGGFRAPVERDTGTAVNGMALGDLDRDGTVEILVADTAGGAVGVVPTTVRGAHGALADLAGLGLAQPRALALRDLDGDQRLDLAAGNGNTLVTRVGRGDRSFGGGAATAPRPGTITAVAIADVDNDGLRDVVTAECDAPAVAVFRGVGDATLRAPVAVALPRCPTSLEVAELTGDGRPDLLLGLVADAASGAQVALLVGRGDGTFGPPERLDLGPADASAEVVATSADLDADGALDLAAATTAGQAGVVYGRRALGITAHPARESVPFGADATAPEPVDVNHDGWPDLVTLLPAAGRLEIALSVEGREFVRAAGVELALQPWSVVATDLDRDGAVDLAVTDRDGANLVVLRGDATGTFVVDHTRTLGNCPAPVARCGPAGEGAHERLRVADLDADGRRELHAGTCAGDLLVLSDYVAGVGFATQRRTAGTRCTEMFDLLDVGGRFAHLTFDETSRGVTAHLPAGPVSMPNFVLSMLPGLSRDDAAAAARAGDLGALFPAGEVFGGRISVADLDADGVEELVVSGLGDEGRGRWIFSWRKPAGVDWGAALGAADALTLWEDYYESPPHPRAEAALDLDGDGRLEWGWVRPTLGVFSTTVSDGGGHLEIHTPAGADAATFRVADFDRNGAPDVVVGAPGAGAATVLRTQTPGRWSQHLTDPTTPGTALAPGATSVSMRQSAQRLDQLAIVARVEGASAGDLSFVLRSPGGQCVPLPAPAPVDGVLRLHADARTTPALAALLGAQPHGPWSLSVENAGADTPVLRSFAVHTGGAFVGNAPGVRRERPQPLRLGGGALGRAQADATLGGVDATALSCGATHDAAGLAPERWYELQVAQRRTVAFQLAADFPAGLELRSGACAAGGPALDCRAGGFSPALPPRSLAAGTYCLVVDGDLSDGTGRAALGRFDLFTTVDAPWVAPATPAPAALCDPPPAPEREVACGADACLGPEVCCAGFAGVSCGLSCGGGTLAITCDGPEDCAPGEACCAGFPQGAVCRADCGADLQTRCHADADCSGGLPCQGCNFPPLGVVDVCAAVCP